MTLPKDDSFQTCQIKRNVEGHYDENMQWIEGGLQVIANAEVDIQPKSGRERASALQTKYESDYVGFVDIVDITFKNRYLKIKKGDTLIDADGTEYGIVFPGQWSEHYEMELKEQ